MTNARAGEGTSRPTGSPGEITTVLKEIVGAM